MNKKSIILSLLLCAGLLIPQETKPIFGDVLAISSIVYGVVLLNTIGVPHNLFRTKNHITDYTKEQIAIREYKAQIVIAKKAGETTSTVLNTEIRATSPEIFIALILDKTEQFISQKNIRLTISSTIILHDNRECPLKKISTKKISKKILIKKLEQVILVDKNIRSTFSTALRCIFLSSSIITIPFLWALTAMEFYLPLIQGIEALIMGLKPY